MPRNTSFVLSDHFTDFIDHSIESGRYSSASDVVRAGLRMLEEEEKKLKHLRALSDEGEASGPGEPWDHDAFLAEMHRQVT